MSAIRNPPQPTEILALSQAFGLDGREALVLMPQLAGVVDEIQEARVNARRATDEAKRSRKDEA